MRLAGLVSSPKRLPKARGELVVCQRGASHRGRSPMAGCSPRLRSRHWCAGDECCTGPKRTGSAVLGLWLGAVALQANPAELEVATGMKRRAT